MDSPSLSPSPSKPHHHGSPYGYTPTQWICILYVVLFALLTLIHTLQALLIRPRLLWLLPTLVICGICETLGWSARLWSSSDPSNINPFLMQITTTILAPTFLTAALYTILGRMISLLGAHYSRLSPRAYLIAFLSADVLALVVQAVGGAKASLAFQAGHDPTPGAHIMLAGIFLQMAGIILYLVLAVEFFLRVYTNTPVRPLDPSKSTSPSLSPTPSYPSKPLRVPAPLRTLALALTLATLLVLMRAVYRALELLGGWRGRIITTEKYFAVLDAGSIVVAMAVLASVPVGIFLR